MISEIWLKTARLSGGSRFDARYLVQHSVEHRLVAEAVGAHQRIDSHSALRQAPCVFEGRRRQLDFFDRDGVADRGEYRGDVSVDAVTQQLQQLRVAAQFGNFRDQCLLDRAGHLGHSLVQPADDCRRRPSDDRGFVMARFRHDQTLVPQVSPIERFAAPRTRTRPDFVSGDVAENCGRDLRPRRRADAIDRSACGELSSASSYSRHRILLLVLSPVIVTVVTVLGVVASRKSASTARPARLITT